MALEVRFELAKAAIAHARKVLPPRPRNGIDPAEGALNLFALRRPGPVPKPRPPVRDDPIAMPLQCDNFLIVSGVRLLELLDEMLPVLDLHSRRRDQAAPNFSTSGVAPLLDELGDVRALERLHSVGSTFAPLGQPVPLVKSP